MWTLLSNHYFSSKKHPVRFVVLPKPQTHKADEEVFWLVPNHGAGKVLSFNINTAYLTSVCVIICCKTDGESSPLITRGRVLLWLSCRDVRGDNSQVDPLRNSRMSSDNTAAQKHTRFVLGFRCWWSAKCKIACMAFEVVIMIPLFIKDGGANLHINRRKHKQSWRPMEQHLAADAVSLFRRTKRCILWNSGWAVKNSGTSLFLLHVCSVRVPDILPPAVKIIHVFNGTVVFSVLWHAVGSQQPSATLEEHVYKWPRGGITEMFSCSRKFEKHHFFFFFTVWMRF